MMNWLRAIQHDTSNDISGIIDFLFYFIFLSIIDIGVWQVHDADFGHQKQWDVHTDTTVPKMDDDTLDFCYKQGSSIQQLIVLMVTGKEGANMWYQLEKIKQNMEPEQVECTVIEGLNVPG